MLLITLLSSIAIVSLFYTLRRRRARKSAYLERLREFQLLSQLRGFRRRFLRQAALNRINADPTQRHLPRRAMRTVYELLRSPVPTAGGAAVAA